jgi:hypothetical protein
VLYDPIIEKFTVMKPWWKPRPTHDCSASKEDIVKTDYHASVPNFFAQAVL